MRRYVAKPASLLHKPKWRPVIRRFITASAEQQLVVEHCLNKNVLCSARPGAGKTTTAEFLVRANPGVPIALITYSKRLQLATKHRLEEYDAAQSFTFHGLASKLFGRLTYDDAKLLDLRKQNFPVTWSMPHFRYVVFDEMQDCTPDLFWLACMFVSAVTQRSGTAPNLLILGDVKQAIYEFRGADARYLEHAATLFSTLSPYPWHGEKYIVGAHDGPDPVYMTADIYDHNALVDAFMPYIKRYGAERCAILAPFVRNNGWLIRLCNALSDKNILMSVPISDEAKLDEDVLNGKVSVATWHQFKGSERDCVFVFGADSSYFDILGRDLPDDRCPNAAFVALTRARKQLVVVQSHKLSAMPFVDQHALHRHAKVVSLTGIGPTPQKKPGRPIELGLLLPTNVMTSEIARHVRDELLNDIVTRHLQIVELKEPSPSEKFSAIPEKVCTNSSLGHYEAVSDLNGLVVTAALELTLQGTLRSFGYGHAGPGPKKHLPKIPASSRERAIWLMRQATMYDAERSGYKSRMVQMELGEDEHGFAWFSSNNGRLLDLAVQRLQDEVLSVAPDQTALEFERQFKTKITLDEEVTTLSGRTDITYEEVCSGKKRVTIWEVKFVAMLSLEHVVQAVTYAHLWWMQQQPKQKQRRHIPEFPNIVLFNVRTGEKWDIRSTPEQAQAIIEATLRAKYTSEGEPSIDEFLHKTAVIIDSVEKRMKKLEEPMAMKVALVRRASKPTASRLRN
ncbi:P-loop containing nucleoside triphosphate hydrolase protein [Auriculariales sp. MPI-PUGE-AT-0066]|nr:P-loop containing nucleoside triphosphate hydrolase protein [Auriculariales sp. MPI-PUGE-AT-0066]